MPLPWSNFHVSGTVHDPTHFQIHLLPVPIVFRQLFFLSATSQFDNLFSKHKGYLSYFLPLSIPRIVTMTSIDITECQVKVDNEDQKKRPFHVGG